MKGPVEIKAQGASAVAVSRAPAMPEARKKVRAEAKPEKDPFRFGWRERRTTAADGREIFEQVPLTYEEFLYPQEGDVLGQGLIHFLLLHPWADAVRRFLWKRRPTFLVTCDVFLCLRSDGRNSAPDIAVIDGDVDPDDSPRVVDLEAVGGRLLFAFEAISDSDKEIEAKDLEVNLERYAAEGVREYFSVYPMTKRKVSRLVGRRLNAAKRYVEIPPDAEGRVYSEQIGLFFSIDPASEELVMVDAESGERLRISDEEEARAEEAERCATEEAAVRRREAEARRGAERRAVEEAAARRRAEARVERLESELRRLRGGD